jgi:hypothetical protein
VTFSPFQIGFAVLILLAIWAGRPHPRISAAIVGNFLCSVALSKIGMPDADRLIWMGVTDSLTALALLGLTWRQNIAAACYGAMVIVYPFAVILEVSEAATYSCIEVLGALALVVIGGLDKGIRILSRALSRAAGAVRRRTGFAFHHNCGSVPQRVALPLVARGTERR